MSSIWTVKATALLLSEYKKHEHLYDVKHVDYHNRRKRLNSLSALREVLKKEIPNITVHAIRMKMHSLRCQYLRKWHQARPTVDVTSDSWKSTLWFQDKMAFLKPHLTSRHLLKPPKAIKKPQQSRESIADTSRSDSPECKPKTPLSISTILNQRTKEIAIGISELKSQLSQKDDEIELLGKLIGHKLRKLKNEDIQKNAFKQIHQVLESIEMEDEERDFLSITSNEYISE